MYSYKGKGDQTEKHRGDRHTKKRRRQHKCGERGWSIVVTSQGIPTASGSWKRQGADYPLEPQERRTFDFGLLANRTVSEYISVISSHPVGGNVIQQPQNLIYKILLTMDPRTATVSQNDHVHPQPLVCGHTVGPAHFLMVSLESWTPTSLLF